MRHFNKDHKINFVDENNVLVGFDNYRDCCEDFGWLLTRDIPKSKEHEEVPVPDCNNNDYVFDVSYCNMSTITEDLECGDSVTFKLYSKSNKEDILLNYRIIRNVFLCKGIKHIYKGKMF